MVHHIDSKFLRKRCLHCHYLLWQYQLLTVYLSFSKQRLKWGQRMACSDLITVPKFSSNSLSFKKDNLVLSQDEILRDTAPLSVLRDYWKNHRQGSEGQQNHHLISLKLEHASTFYISDLVRNEFLHCNSEIIKLCIYVYVCVYTCMHTFMCLCVHIHTSYKVIVCIIY